MDSDIQGRGDEKNCGCFVNFFFEAEGCWKESSMIEIPDSTM